MKDFSQSGEQKIILDYFGITPPGRIEEMVSARTASGGGVFASIGENDGLTFSNVRALALSGWKGICVEPAETAFKKLKALYSYEDSSQWGEPVRCVQAAITPTDGSVDFYDSGTHLKKGDTSLLSTTRPEELARWKKSGETFTKTTVRGITFETLMKETGVNHFDFVSIDCEGVDLEVLRQMDLTALGTRMVCVEVNRNDQRPFDEHCMKHGLKLLHRNYENAIYAR